MLHLTILCMGRLKEPYYISACQEYQKRLTAYCRLDIIELPENGDIAARIPKGSYVIALCIEGDKTDSLGLAERLNALANQGSSRICLLIGGSDGLPQSAKAKANWLLSMSDMTFPHHLARVMLLEQIYRAMSINAGSKYHK